jgi:hypothetical protein
MEYQMKPRPTAGSGGGLAAIIEGRMASRVTRFWSPSRLFDGR